MVACVLCAVTMVAAQDTGPRFEVASVKLNKSGDLRKFVARRAGGVTVSNMPVRDLIIYAYRLAPFQIVGGPAWISSNHFDILGKLEGNPTGAIGALAAEAIPAALQRLLEDRFKLRVHRERRTMDIYALVTLRPGIPGPELKPFTADCADVIMRARRGQPPTSVPPGGCSTSTGSGVLRFGGFPLSQFATILGQQVGRMVVDHTELAGAWQFELHFAPDQGGGPAPGADVGPAPSADAPSLFTAVQEQLGLKLEATKGPVDVLVVDGVEQPTLD
jgi:uncharacterized protein (TIGR03435 family)